ncbi:MAG: rhodanese-like domain-containing protein [Eggerthellaceae bacterium]|nr:rhodanese-like domain-containing protein [Eggerthellaceae bacterium]
MSFDNSPKRMDINDGVRLFRETPGAVLLDVRPPEFAASGSIPGTTHLPINELNRITEVVPAADTPLFVYCTAGILSEQAARALAQAGYTNVANIGGIMAYKGELE